MQSIVANLAPASGRQDHTTSPSASTAPVLRRQRVHRIPHPTFVTIAIRPSSSGAGRLESVKLCLPNGQAKYFCGRGWTRAAHHTGWFARRANHWDARRWRWARNLQSSAASAKFEVRINANGSPELARPPPAPPAPQDGLDKICEAHIAVKTDRDFSGAEQSTIWPNYRCSHRQHRLERPTPKAHLVRSHHTNSGQ